MAEKNRELQQLKSEKESLQALLDAARQATSEEGQIANDRIVGLENEISSLITSKSALALKICVLEADLATNQRETDRLESLCATQTTSLESLSRIEKEYSTKLFNSETSRKAISDELDGLKKSCVHVQDKLDQALRKNASLVEEFAAKSAQTERDIMSKEEALQESKSSIVKLESSLTYLQAQLSGKVNELEVVTANMAESARTLLELQHSSATLTSENESLKSSLDDIKESNVQLEARLKEVIDSSEHQLSTSSEHTSLIKQLEADMDSLKSAIESKSKELDVLNHDLTCSKNVSSQLQSQLQEAQQHAEELEKVKVDLDQANMDLKTLLQQQRDSLSAESSCAQKQLQEQAQSLMEREKEISDLTSSLAKERNSLEQLQEALSSQEKSRELLQADIEELSIKHDAVSSELKSTLEIMSEKKSLEKEMEDIIDGLSNENNKLTGRLDQVEEELIQQGATAAVAQAELESQVARLTSSETLLKGELETLVVESRKKSTTISELKKEVARWEQDLALAQDTLSKTETERGKLVQQLSDARMQLVNMQSVLEKSKQANETSLADLEKDIVQKNSEMDQLQRSYNDIQSKSEKLLEEYQSALETLGVAKSACENDHVSKMILTELQTR